MGWPSVLLLISTIRTRAFVPMQNPRAMRPVTRSSLADAINCSRQSAQKIPRRGRCYAQRPFFKYDGFFHLLRFCGAFQEDRPIVCIGRPGVDRAWNRKSPGLIVRAAVHAAALVLYDGVFTPSRSPEIPVPIGSHISLYQRVLQVSA